MSKYIFQYGGDQQQYSDQNFFNSLVDQSQQPDYSQQYEPDNSTQPEEDNDYIKNLRSYDEEQSRVDDSEAYFKKLDDLEQRINSRFDQLEQFNQQQSWLSSDDGVEHLNDLYDSRTNSSPVISDAEARYEKFKSLAQPQGIYHSSTSGNFQSFATPQEGRNALLNQLNLYQTGQTKNPVHPNSTLLQAMQVYAPAADRNDPVHYAKFIADKIGVSINTPINQIDANKWADAITQMEGNKHGNNPGNLRPSRKYKIG